MIFGTNPTYLYGELYKGKFYTAEKTYKVDHVPVECDYCPAKLEEENSVSVLKSYDEKLTVIKKKQPKGRLLTVRVAREDERVREVILYDNSDIFPGLRTTGSLEMVNGQNMVLTGKGRGPIVFQNNEHKAVIDCVLYKIEGKTLHFAEIGNPVERCRVRVDKDLKNTKIVSNGNIRGVLLDYRGGKDEIDVYVRRVGIGSYIFVEDISEGLATVKLLGKNENGNYSVEHNGFVGECADTSVEGVMKGLIYDVKGASFKFRQLEPRELAKKIAAEKRAMKEAKPKKIKDTVAAETKQEGTEEFTKIGEKGAKKAVDETVSAEAEKKERTEEFVEVEIRKKAKVESVEDAGEDQFRVIELARNCIKAGEDPLPLMDKFIRQLTDKAHLCLFYLKYLEENGRLGLKDVSRMVKAGGPKIYALIVDAFDSQEVLRFVYSKKKSKPCYIKLLACAEDKVEFLKKHREFLEYAIHYIYKHLPTPRPVVESIIGSNFADWMAYLENESGAYKRGLFRKLTAMKLKPAEMKKVFEMWLEFEESSGGNAEEVRELARGYVLKQEQAN